MKTANFAFDVNTYAHLSVRTYDKAGDNRMFIPDGFIETSWEDDDENSYGFSAGVYKHKSKNAVVIAFTGTNETLVKDFVETNFPAAFGNTTMQMIKACELIMKTIKENPEADISFTGHSLGGGLASVMGVLFNKPSAIFDAAPFAKSAWSQEVLKELHNIVKKEGGNTDFESYLNFSLLEEDVPSLKYPDFTHPEIKVDDNTYYGLMYGKYSERVHNVEGWYTEGEMLKWFRPFRPFAHTIHGQEHIVEIGKQELGGIGLHSMVLLQGLLRSEAFRKAVSKLPYALELMADTDLYAIKDTEKDEKNIDFLIQIVKQDVGGYIENGGRLFEARPVLDYLAHDLEKLVVLNDDAIKQKAIMAQMIEWYYYKSKDYQFNPDEGYFFKGDNGVLQYNTAKGEGFSDVAGNADKFVEAWLQKLAKAGDLIDDEHQGTIPNVDTDVFKDKDQWNVFAGKGNHSAAALEKNKTQAMIGGEGADEFTSGDKDDVLVGNGGSDTLYGKGGNDVLYAGYIRPADYASASKHQYIGDAHSTNYLYGGQGEDILHGSTGKDYLYGGDNEDGEADKSKDILYGGRGEDYLYGGAGNDLLYAAYDEKGEEDRNRTNRLHGGKGDDKLYGALGDDELFGGDDNDLLQGNKGADTLDGGKGYDTYLADKQDTIIDSDGVGAVKLDEKVLRGGRRNRNKGAYVGIQFTLPLYSGGATASRVRESESRHAQKKAELDAESDQLRLQVKQTWALIHGEQAQIKALQQLLDTNSAKLDSTRLGRQVGVRNTIDEIQAEAEKAAAQEQLAEAKYRYLAAYLQLLHLSGKLSKEEGRDFALSLFLSNKP